MLNETEGSQYAFNCVKHQLDTSTLLICSTPMKVKKKYCFMRFYFNYIPRPHRKKIKNKKKPKVIGHFDMVSKLLSVGNYDWIVILPSLSALYLSADITSKLCLEKKHKKKNTFLLKLNVHKLILNQGVIFSMHTSITFAHALSCKLL